MTDGTGPAAFWRLCPDDTSGRDDRCGSLERLRGRLGPGLKGSNCYREFAMSIAQHSCAKISLICLNKIPPQSGCLMSIMNDAPVFEIRITTSETGSILRAPSEREVAAKAETLLRRVHARGELIGFSIIGPSAAGIGRLKAYLEDVLIEVSRLSL